MSILIKGKGMIGMLSKCCESSNRYCLPWGFYQSLVNILLE